VKKVKIYTDGACKGNPGIGGWGVVLIYNGKVKTLQGADKETTNNRMELMAAIQALNALTEKCYADLHTDSIYLQQGISTWIAKWKRNKWRTANKKPVKNQDLWEQIDIKTQEHEIHWHWIKAHAGIEYNELADELANNAITELLKEQSA